MPVVTIWGIPRTVSELQINAYLRPDLKKVVAGIPELKISPKQVSVFLHQENTEDSGFASSQNDVVVFVDLFESTQRTEDVLNQLCKVVVNKIKGFTFAKDMLVECFCRPLDPNKGFWSSAI